MSDPTGAIPPLAARLGLAPHPEGGWYRRDFTSPVEVALPDGRVRPSATMITFLLPAGETSAWHRVASSEVWLARTGVVLLELGGTGDAAVPGERFAVGVDLDAGQVGHAVVPPGVWQRTRPGAADALVGCLVSPGFDFADLELAGGPGDGPVDGPGDGDGLSVPPA